MRLLLSPLVLAAAAPAVAQQYAFELAPNASQASLTTAFAIDLPGSLIGDYDLDTNPRGTRTLPGLFGGSGNQPVDAAFGFLGDSDLTGAPTGAFGMDLDLEAGTVDVSGLALDLLGGEDGTTDLTLQLEFQTFRTFAPDSIFIGDFPLDIPIGSQVARDVTLTQLAPSVGGTIRGDRGDYVFGTVVPVGLSFVLVVGELEAPVGPLPLLLPLQGELSFRGQDVTCSFALDLSESQVIEDPLPDFELADVPFDLPTILPPGQVAHLLLSATIASLSLDVDLDLSVVAGGQAACGFEPYCPGNVNSTGWGAGLLAVGSAALGDEDLTFVGSNLPPWQFAYLMMARERDEVPFFRGSQGTLCLEMPVLKFTPHVVPIDGAGGVEVPVDFGDLPPGVDLLPGDVWNFQLWYRDMNPGMSTNTSNAVEVLFCR